MGGGRCCCDSYGAARQALVIISAMGGASFLIHLIQRPPGAILSPPRVGLLPPALCFLDSGAKILFGVFRRVERPEPYLARRCGVLSHVLANMRNVLAADQCGGAAQEVGLGHQAAVEQPGALGHVGYGPVTPVPLSRIAVIQQL